MMELFSLIAIVTILNLGIEILLSDGMALENVRRWAENKKSRVFEPLVYCVWCRPSTYSVFGFLIACGIGVIDFFSLTNLVLYPIVVAGSSFLSGFMWSVYKLIEVKIKYYAHMEQQEYFNLKQRKQDYLKHKK